MQDEDFKTRNFKLGHREKYLIENIEQLSSLIKNVVFIFHITISSCIPFNDKSCCYIWLLFIN